VDSFKYLGATIDSDGRSSNEIRIRIAQTKSAFAELANILTNPRISFKTRKIVLDRHVIAVMAHGSAAWTISKNTVSTINATEMWCLRRMLRVFYMDSVSNEEVLRRAGEKRSLCRNIIKKQGTFFGLVMRRQKLEHLVTTGKINGRRSRGR